MRLHALIASLAATATFAAAAAVALLVGPGAAAALSGLAAVAALAGGLWLTGRAAREAREAGAALDGIAAALEEGKPLAPAAHLDGEAQAATARLHAAVSQASRFTALMLDMGQAFAKGDLPPPAKDAFRGAPSRATDAWNTVIANTTKRQADLMKLLEAGKAGKLDVRIDVSSYSGYNGKLLTLIGELLETVQGPVKAATATLERLAHRDLTARMSGTYPGDYARLQESLNGTAQELNQALAQVQTSADEVASAAGEIASSSQAVASGASEQASSLEETSSSLESMASMVKTAADNAQQASALAQSAKSVAGEGADAMQQMAGAMESIRASAEGTSQIIKDINEIAFQTNLLALNAAVEAARAGAAGRGFAVVAEEVRSLALRSKEAANKTEALIRESVRQTGEGDTTAKLVAGKLGEITSMVAKVSDIVGEIAAAAREQATGIDQVTNAVGQMNKVTQQNAANSEQSSAAATELSSQSAELKAVVGNFVLSTTAASRHAAPARPASLKPAAPKPATSPARKAAAAPKARPVAPAKPAAAAPRAPAAPRKNGAHAGIPMKPEDLIPLDGDPAFEDF